MVLESERISFMAAVIKRRKICQLSGPVWVKLCLQSCLSGYSQWHNIRSPKGFKDRRRQLPGGELGQREGWGEAPERVWRGGQGAFPRQEGEGTAQQRRHALE